MESDFVETTLALCAITRPPPRSAFPAVDATPRGANDLNPGRWVLSLRCYLLSLLRIHRPDCELCKARETCGDEMRKRLEELNWPTQPPSLNNEDHGEAVKVFDSKSEVVASSAIARVRGQQRKAG
jgi:hypothetical protein